jgi:Transposase DDE domain
MKEPPLKESLETLQQIAAQDLEPDPGGGGRRRIREGVAPDRRISIEDPEMRHDRKSKSQRIKGYKRHIAADLDTDLILAAAITPANRPEAEATPDLQKDIEHQARAIGELYIDRGYIRSPLVQHVLGISGEVICRPWVPRNKDNALFTKAEFRLNLRDLTITCPANEVQPFRLGTSVEFNPETCDRCPLRSKCTKRQMGHGRQVTIADDERLQQRLRKAAATKKGRTRLRERVSVEHRLAHIARRQGRRARYLGVRRNLFDLRRASALQNLETIHRKMAA